MKNSTHARFLPVACAAVGLLAGNARAELQPDWVSLLPAGTSLYAGMTGMVVDAAGNSYVTGTNGPSGNVDVLTAAFGPDGALLWSRTFDGPAGWHDQGRALALGPGGMLWVVGNTPGPGSYANVLLLAYDTATGTLLHTVQYSSGAFTSEFGGSVAVDAQGNVYVGGGTVGDGPDVMVLKFDAAGQFQWKRTWDGPAASPYSQDTVRQVQLAPDGNLVVLIHGVMNTLHPDYVVVKYASGDGSTLWQATWGVNGGDFPRDMAIDAVGDVYVTGTGIDFTDKFSTIKVRGSDGTLLWQAYDWAGIDDAASAVVLDGAGGVYVTGAVDPDGDQSNFNDNVYTVKRDAATGAFLWSHLYGANCIGCFDVPADVIVDPAGHVFVAANTSSPPYGDDVITLVLDAATGLETERGIVSGAVNERAVPGILRFDSAFNLYDGGGTYHYNTGEIQMMVFRYASMVGGPVVVCEPGVAGVMGCPCGNPPSGGGRGCDNSAGTGGATLTANGTASVSADTLSFTATGERSSAFSLLLEGSGNVPGGLMYGQGVRCVGGTLKRLFRGSAAGGVVTFPDVAAGDSTITQRAAALGSPIPEGGTRWYLVYYRDPNVMGGCPATSTFNAGPTVRVDWVP